MLYGFKVQGAKIAIGGGGGGYTPNASALTTQQSFFFLFIFFFSNGRSIMVSFPMCSSISYFN